MSIVYVDYMNKCIKVDGSKDEYIWLYGYVVILKEIGLEILMMLSEIKQEWFLLRIISYEKLDLDGSNTLKRIVFNVYVTECKKIILRKVKRRRGQKVKEELERGNYVGFNIIVIYRVYDF